jgi:hypothetical protein
MSTYATRTIFPWVWPEARSRSASARAGYGHGHVLPGKRIWWPVPRENNSFGMDDPSGARFCFVPSTGLGRSKRLLHDTSPILGDVSPNVNRWAAGLPTTVSRSGSPQLGRGGCNGWRCAGTRQPPTGWLPRHVEVGADLGLADSAPGRRVTGPWSPYAGTRITGIR